MKQQYIVLVICVIAISLTEAGKVFDTVGDIAAGIIDSELGALALDLMPYGDKVKSVLTMIAPPQRSPNNELQENDKSTIRRIVDFVGQVMFFFLYSNYF